MRTQVRSRQILVKDTIPAMVSLRTAATVVTLVIAAYVALLVSAIVRSGIGLVICALAVTAGEVLLQRQAPLARWALARVAFGGPARGLLRGLGLVVYAARTNSPAVIAGTVSAVVVIALAAALRNGAREVLEFVRTPAAVSRGLPLSVAAPPRPPASLLVRPGGYVAAVEVCAALGLALAAHGRAAYAVAGLLVAGLLSLLPALAIAEHLRRLGGLRFGKVWTRAVWRAVDEYQAEVVVYLGGGVEWTYTLETWLDVLEALPRRVLVCLRDVDVLRTLAPTQLPIICVPGAVALMQLPLPTPKAVLYVANEATNIHFMRRRGTRTVFIGHGDSDKAASSNPFARVYNEVWVAGPAGRDRYRAAGVDIADSAFVEVGRPQLPDLPRRLEPAPTFTVLYAPTWEGWDGDTTDSSLWGMGPDLVRALLVQPNTRVMYRPHPQTGRRDPAVRQANQEIIAMLQAAGGQAAPWDNVPTHGARPSAASVDVLDDVLDRSVTAESRRAHGNAARDWADAYWIAATGHRILTAPAPDLYSCFQFTDLLIADISSLVADFLAANRPYAVTNTTGLSAEEFAARSTSAGGGFVLDHDLGNLERILDAARGGADPTVAARERTRSYLLGPRGADPAAPFRANIERLCRTDLPSLPSAPIGN